METRKILANVIIGILIASGLGVVSLASEPVNQEFKGAPLEIPFGTVERIPLSEDFTNYGCGPCATFATGAEPAIDNLAFDGVTPVYYHVWWPTAGDPIYEYNVAQNQALVARYGFSGVPSWWLDGSNSDPQGDPPSWPPTQIGIENMINAAGSVPSRVYLESRGYLDTSANEGTVSVYIQVLDPLPTGNYVLQLSLWEDHITRYGILPNGEDDYRFACWDMVPDQNGSPLTISEPGEYQIITQTFPINAAWDPSMLGMAVFIQNLDNLYVEQSRTELFQNPWAELISPGQLTPDEVLGGTIDIDWWAFDTDDGESLTIDLEYSTDNGATWNPIASGLPNTPPYSWDTVVAGVPDSPNYLIQLTATDSSANSGSGILSRSIEHFSLDNIANDRWYLQTESANLAPNLDLDMKPTEQYEWDAWNLIEVPGQSVIDVTGAGEYVVQSYATEFLSDDVYDIGGAWDFSIYAKTGASTPSANGNLYARIYAHDGATSRLMATTTYDDELIGAYTNYHQFSWTYNAPSMLLWTGERVIVEIMLHATAGTSTALYSNNARSEIAFSGTVTNDYTNTFVSDDADEQIQEEVNYITRFIDQDFSGASFPPSGWYIENTGTTGSWSQEATNNAGGTAPEARFVYGTSGTGTSRLIYGPFDTTGQTSLTLTWNTFYDAYATGVTVKVQTSVNGATWTDSGWQIVGGTVNVGPALQTRALTTGVGSATYYIAYVVDGNSYQLDAWYNDDILLIPTGEGQTSLLEHKWIVKVPVGDSPFQFNIEASRVAGTDNDNFQFAYSTDDVSYTNMVTVNSATDATYSYSLPAGLPEDVYIRVLDTVRTAGATSLSRIDIDRMYIASTSPATCYLGYDHYAEPSYIEPYLGPVADNKPVVNILTPDSVTADQIIGGSTYSVTWTATDVEDPDSSLDIRIEYSANGGGAWTVLEDGTDNNDGAYSWNTAGLPDGVNYMLRITARDSLPHTGYDASDYPFSIDNTLNDRWYLQVQTVGPNNRLNMMPIDLGPNVKTTPAISTAGDYLIGTWQTDTLSATDINGVWNFDIYGRTSNNIGTGYMYARVYRSTGPTLLDTTVYDDENIFTYGSNHLFSWTDTLAGTLTSGESLLVEIWAGVTNIPSEETLTTSGTTQAGGPHNVWFCDNDDNSQTEMTTPNSATEFTDTYYTNAALSDNVRAGPSADPGVQDEIFVKCSFATTVNPAIVTGITFTYEAQYSTANEIVTIYAWNYGTNTWDAIGTTMTFTTLGTDYTITRSVASGFANYISGGVILWGAYASIRGTCSVDFLQVQLTYSQSATVSLNFDYIGSESFVEPTLGGGGAPTPYGIDLSGKAANSWVFVSFPIAISGNIQTILNDATLGDSGTAWTIAKWYDPQTPADPWKTYRVGGTANDLTTINNAIGVWLWITANSGDQTLTTGVTGDYSPTAVAISLYTGWNIVGYPTATSRAESATLPAEADLVASWQAASPYITQHTKGATMMVAGNAYWVHVTADCTWTVQP